MILFRFVITRPPKFHNGKKKIQIQIQPAVGHYTSPIVTYVLNIISISTTRKRKNAEKHENKRQILQQLNITTYVNLKSIRTSSPRPLSHSLGVDSAGRTDFPNTYTNRNNSINTNTSTA